MESMNEKEQHEQLAAKHDHNAGQGQSLARQEDALDLAAVQQNSKSRKTGVSLVELALTNIEKAQLVPEI